MNEGRPARIRYNFKPEFIITCHNEKIKQRVADKIKKKINFQIENPSFNSFNYLATSKCYINDLQPEKASKLSSSAPFLFLVIKARHERTTEHLNYSIFSKNQQKNWQGFHIQVSN